LLSRSLLSSEVPSHAPYTDLFLKYGYQEDFLLLLFRMLSACRCVASNDRIYDERWTAKDFHGCSHGMIEMLFHHLPVENEENHEVLNQYGHCSGQDSNWAYPKYESLQNVIIAPMPTLRRNQINTYWLLPLLDQLVMVQGPVKTVVWISQE
jgi:hypothetical protein